MAASIDGAHVLIIPLPIHGHVNPMLHLAAELSSAGFSVTFVTTSSTNQAAVKALASIGGSGSNFSGSISLQALDDGNRSSSYDFGESIRFLASKTEELGRLIEDYGPFTYNVLDFLLLQPFKSIPAMQGVTTAGFWTSSAAMLHVVVNVQTLLDKGYLPLSSKNGLHTVDSSVIPGLSSELCVYSDLPEDPLDPSFNSMLGVRACLLEAPLLLVNTFEELEKKSLSAIRQQGLNVVSVGPLLQQPKHPSAAASEIFQWLDTQTCSSVLYVSFGTMLTQKAEQIIEVACGLEASQQPFLWVLRESSQQSEEVTAALKGLKERTGRRSLVVDWSPQFEVLKHQSVGGFLTHCGWNSTLEAVTCGVPMIGWPSVGDQFINCKYMADVWKVGIRIISRKPTVGSLRIVRRDEIERAATSLMIEDSSIRSQAEELSQKADEVMLSGNKKQLKDVFIA